MADKTKESKWLKVATAGPTVDRREIKEQWLIDMAETYDEFEYTASIFEDHITWAGNYGRVTAVKKGKDEKGRVCLFVKVIPNKRLLKLNEADQKLFTSIQVAENFLGSGKAYLTHLAITDTPASVGTERLSFSWNGEQAQIFANEDGVELDFNAPQTDEELAAEAKKRPFFKRFFSNSPKEDDPMTDAERAELDKLQAKVDEFSTKLEEVTNKGEPEGDKPNEFAAEIKTLNEKITELEGEKQAFKTQAETLGKLNEDFTKLRNDLDEARQDKTKVPPKSTGESEESFDIF
ncbi:GPO family capsid scaffolding protein [Marinomonas primoryensis]|uniref:GPO family capsid scaffolding protein n=1 Tax=Marinomonas primoryensis TaxID=178399 RepID=UPI003703F42D